MIPRYLCPVSLCPFFTYGIDVARAHLLENERDSNHRARGLTERSLPELVTLGSNPNYIASGPPVRPGYNRPRKDSLERRTQERFEVLLDKEEGQAQVGEVPAYKKFKAFHAPRGTVSPVGNQALDRPQAAGEVTHPASQRTGRVQARQWLAPQNPPST